MCRASTCGQCWKEKKEQEFEYRKNAIDSAERENIVEKNIETFNIGSTLKSLNRPHTDSRSVFND
jgi:hypothetical protein